MQGRCYGAKTIPTVKQMHLADVHRWVYSFEP